MILEIELVPKNNWYLNLRSELTKTKWDIVRRKVYNNAGYRCEVCGGRGDTWPVECHEKWEYDDENKIQKLTGLIALCPLCHKVKHIGLTKKNGEYDAVLEHFCKINKIDKEIAEKYITEQFNKWLNRSEYTYRLDLTYLDNL